jgi:hypothetical protein
MVQSGKEYSKDLWHEKITDAMNYLVLLLGLLEDTGRAKEKPGPKPQRIRLVEDKK